MITRNLVSLRRSNFGKEGERGLTYECHLLTLCRAINLNMDMELFRLRARIRTGLRELEKAKYLKRSGGTKTDNVKKGGVVMRGRKFLFCGIVICVQKLD